MRPEPLIIKAALALLGAVALRRSLNGYRQRRRDPHAPPDARADRLVRILGWAALVLVGALGALLSLHTAGLLPYWLKVALVAVLAGATLTLFGAALALGGHVGA
jgi:hypothetical protein